MDKKSIIIGFIILTLLISAAFAAGYLYRGQGQRAPIIIEKDFGEEVQ